MTIESLKEIRSFIVSLRDYLAEDKLVIKSENGISEYLLFFAKRMQRAFIATKFPTIYKPYSFLAKYKSKIVAAQITPSGSCNFLIQLNDDFHISAQAFYKNDQLKCGSYICIDCYYIHPLQIVNFLTENENLEIDAVNPVAGFVP